MDYYYKATIGLTKRQAERFKIDYKQSIELGESDRWEVLSPDFCERTAAMHVGGKWLGEKHGPDFEYWCPMDKTLKRIDIKSNFNWDSTKGNNFTLDFPLSVCEDAERYKPGSLVVHVSHDPKHRKILSTVIFAIKPNIDDKIKMVKAKHEMNVYKRKDTKLHVCQKNLDIVSVVFFNKHEFDRKFKNKKIRNGVLFKLKKIWDTKHPIQKRKLRTDQIEKDIIEYFSNLKN
jgi:hypothetical protein